MNKATILFAAGGLMVSSAAIAQSIGEKTGVNSALGISPTTADFVKEAANSDMFEIAAAKIVEDKGNVEEKKFAQQMITDHIKTSSDLQGLVTAGDVKAELPTTMDSSYQKKPGKLRDAKPSGFSGQYNPIQVSAHKDAVSLFERYAKSGDNPRLKDWASKMLPTLQHHLQMAEALKER